jgi:2TM domain
VVDVPAPQITLDQYKSAERAIAHDAARFGLLVHATITVLISALLIVINFALGDDNAPPDQVPWSVFAVGGMGLGLAAHWWFGYLNLEVDLLKQQEKAEARAVELL